MKLDKLREQLKTAKGNLEVKGYKELCTILGEKIETNNNQRERQRKEWSRYFKYSINKKNNRYIIKQIYEEPLPLEETKVKNILFDYNLKHELLKTFCSKELESKENLTKAERQKIFDDYINTNKATTVYLTTNKLALKLGLINKYYLEYLGSPNELSKKIGIDSNNIKEFYLKVTKYYTDDIEATLKRAQKNFDLIYQETYRGDFVRDIRAILKYKENEYKDIKKEVQAVSNKENRELTKEEIEVLQNIRSDILEEWGYKDLSEYLQRNNGNGYKLYREQDKRLFEKIGCMNSYRVYKITFSPKRTLKLKNILEKQLNTWFSDRVIGNKIKDTEEEIRKLCDILTYELDFFGIDDSYLVSERNKQIEAKIHKVEQDCNDFKTLSKELLKDYKYSKIKKIDEKENNKDGNNE